MNPKALYFAAGLLAAGVPQALLLTVPEAAAQSGTERVVVTNEYPANTAALLQIKTRVEAAQCANAEAQAGMSGGTCKVTPGTNTCIHWGDDTDPDGKTTVDTRFLFKLQKVWDAEQ